MAVDWSKVLSGLGKTLSYTATGFEDPAALGEMIAAEGKSAQEYEQWEKEFGLKKREVDLEELGMRKELGQHLIDLKTRHRGNKEKALEELKENMPLLKDLYGSFYEDFDKEIMSNFNTLFGKKKKKPSFSIGGKAREALQDIVTPTAGSPAEIFGAVPQAAMGAARRGLTSPVEAFNEWADRTFGGVRQGLTGGMDAFNRWLENLRR